MSERKSEYMSEGDYTALIASIQSGLRNAESVTKQEALDPGPLHRLAVRVANGVREQFALTRKPPPLPDNAGSIVRITTDDQRSCLYVLGADGVWYLSGVPWHADEMEERVARSGFEVVA